MRAGVPMELWVYLPNPLPAGKLPCVLIAPAGSRLFHGMSLDAGDRVEHLPYVRRGFAVVAYQLDGKMQDRPTDAQARDAIEKFSDAHAGIDNAAAAINYIDAKIPQIDPKRIYAVGHSSAGTLALSGRPERSADRRLRRLRAGVRSWCPSPAGAARIGNAAIRLVRFLREAVARSKHRPAQVSHDALHRRGRSQRSHRIDRRVRDANSVTPTPTSSSSRSRRAGIIIR